MKSLQERITAALARHPDWDDTRISNSLSVPIGAVRAVRDGKSIGEIVTASAPGPEPVGLISLEKVIQKYNIKAAIERELVALPKGKFIEERDLCQRAAVRPTLNRCHGWCTRAGANSTARAGSLRSGMRKRFILLWS